ncbi:MAG: RecX family transcriptional regulator [Planctomycetota bacterium]|nr:RecX family transcriptional regulator [Planctomycetota bacterium]
MPSITGITEQKRTPTRRNIFLDGRYAFPCSVNVVAKYRLRVGLALSEEQINEIQCGEVRQECFDKAAEFLGRRLHSRSELHQKLRKQEYPAAIIISVLDDLSRLGYIDDERFAKTKALSAAEHKQHGRRRAFMELLKCGVKSDTANRALDEVYQEVDAIGLARQLIQKQIPRLRRLDPLVARRRLVGLLQRRGFDYGAMRPMIDEALGRPDEPG